MQDTIYLVLNRRGILRMNKTRMPLLAGGEVAVKLTVRVDDSNFRSPLASAELDIAEDQLILNPTVEVEVESQEEE